MKYRIIIGLLITVLSLALISAGVGWWKAEHKPVMSKVEYVKVPEIKEVVKIKRVNIPGPKEIVTIEKEKIVEKLKLPNWFAQDADEQAIATADLPETESGYNVVATLNTKSGEGNIIAKEKPRSLIGFPNGKEIGVRAGYNSKLTQEISVYGRWNFFRIGNVHLSAYGEGNSEGNAVGQLELGYRF